MTTSRVPSARGLAAAVPDLGLAITFLAVWIAPTRALPGAVTGLLLLMVLEFIIVHSSAFMGSVAFGPGDRARRATRLLGLGAFYTLFVAAFSAAFGSWWPLASFWGLTLNRLLGVLLGQAPQGEEKRFLATGWGVSALFYLGGAFATTWLPFPRLGMTPDVVRALHLPGSGLWISEPHRVLAFGFLYYAATAVSEAFDHRWAARAVSAAPAAGAPETEAETRRVA